MGTFGLRLRGEREARRLSRVDIAKKTKVRVHHLCALEHENLDGLPADGRAEGYLRTYAEYLGLNAEALVDEFRKEARSRHPTPEAPPAEEPEGPEEAEPIAEVVHVEEPPEIVEAPNEEAAPEVVSAEAAPPPLRVEEITIEPAHMSKEPPEVEELPPPPRRGSRPIVTLVLAVVAVLLIVVVVRGIGGTTAHPPSAGITPVELSAPPAETGDASPEGSQTGAAPIEAAVVDPAPPPVRPAAASAPPSRLSIPDHGVGTAIVDKRLVGAAERFGEGTRVWFWTRVTGGRAGERIEHVWIHEGRVMQRARLELGGAHWRTQSKKTLFPGSAGDWVVEARDSAGNVLARREFSCWR